MVRALILHGPDDLRLEELPDPEPGPGEVVIEVLAALTCATDAKMMRAGAHPALGPLPAPLGHEVAGVVREVGPGVDALKPGDTVVVANSAPCLACAPCTEGRPNLCLALTYLTGAFAERLRVPAPIVARNTHPIPGGLAPEIAAAAEPLACALHTAGFCTEPAAREVTILGGGVQGWLLTRVLTGRGARVTLLDPHPERRERALRAGAAAVHEVPRDGRALEDMRATLGEGRGPATVIEAVGRPTAWQMALGLVRAGGQVVLHGGCPPGSVVNLPTGPIHYSEITLRGSYHHTPDVFHEAVCMIATGEIDVNELLNEPVGLEGVAQVLRASRGDKHPVMPQVSI